MTAHALPEVTKAVAEQAGRIIHTLHAVPQPADGGAGRADRGGLRHPGRQGLPDHLAAPRPTTPRCCWPASLRRSNQILALRNSYHGRSFSTIAITGNRTWSPTSLSPFQTYYVHGGQRYRSPVRGPGRRRVHRRLRGGPARGARPVRRRRRRLIAEPIQGVGGFTYGPDGLLGAFAEVLREHGILWISDEVQTGWGRTGEHFWGWQAPRRHDPGHRHVRQGHRQRAVDGRGDRPRPRSWTASRGQLDLDVRRLAAHRGRGAGQPALPARRTTCRPTRRRTARSCSTGCASSARRSSATSAARA